jgi:hypothetical protein
LPGDVISVNTTPLADSELLIGCVVWSAEEDQVLELDRLSQPTETEI